MKILEFDYQNVPIINEDIALCLGYFDAVHLGHQEIIRKAFSSGYKVAIMSFDNPPVVVLKKRKENISLTSNADKAELFSDLGIDYFYILHFDEEVSKLTRYEFIDLILKKINPKVIFCGEDYTFGNNAQGNVSYLKQYFNVEVVNLLMDGDKKVSSREIISLLKEKKVEKASSLLNRNFRICGYVITGQHRGKNIGFPTANLQLDFPYIVPGEGVYMGFATYDNTRYKAIISIGTHPTIMPLSKAIIEVHIIDFDKEIYNELLFVEFVSFIRDNIRFPSIDALAEQLKKDRIKAKKLLK